VRIDSHVHYTPPALWPGMAEREPYWGLLLGSDPGPGAAGHAGLGPERLIEDMDAAGIDRVVLMGNYWADHAACVVCNDERMALARRWPGRLLPFASIQPKAGPAAIDELERCLDGGMGGVGELGPYGQGYGLDDPDFLRLAEACIEHDVPLNLHVSEEVGHFYPGKSTTPLSAYCGLALRYPELKLVLAHWGGGLIFYEIMPEVRRALVNVCYDTAASPLLYPTGSIFKLALQTVDPAKVLYGSDYPLPICRKAQRGPDFRPFLAEIDGLGLDPETCDGILGGNAARRLGLGPVRPPRHDGPAPEPRAALMPPPGVPAQLGPKSPVALVARTWPGTRPVFERFGIPWQDTPVPFWEPIVQAAAAHGLGPAERERLMAELREAIEGETES
jgi:uncharacterized protein